MAISTSSPLISIAVIDGSTHEIVFHESSSEQHQTSKFLSLQLSRIQEELGSQKLNLDAIVVDEGPGSFTGTRIGITFAKALSFAKRLEIWSVSSFDLINPTGVVAISSRKGRWVVRDESRSVRIELGLPKYAVGWGSGMESPQYPDLSNVSNWLLRVRKSDALALTPNYDDGPAVSEPNSPLVQVES